MSAATGKRLFDRSWRYGVVGLVCAAANYLILIAVDRLHGNYLVGATAAFVIVVPIGYVLQASFTFAEPLRLKSFMRFLAGAASAYPIAVGMLAILCSGFGLGIVMAAPIAAVAMVVWNFAAAHWAILPKYRRAKLDRAASEA